MISFNKQTAVLLFACITSMVSADPWKPAPGPLSTKWAAQVKPDAVLPEYPRPQLVREKWLNLNGLWEYGLTEAASLKRPDHFDGQILVPFPWESSLSGVGKPCIPDKRLWYRRTFTVPEGWDLSSGQVMLRFGAVTWDCSVEVNGSKVGGHRGGYTGFSFEISRHLKAGANELVVSAWNPVNADVEDAQVLGKQRQKPGGIFYTPATGIWQTVWIEPVPELGRIDEVKLASDIDHELLGIRVVTASDQGESQARVMAGGKVVQEAVIKSNTDETISIPSPRLWTPEDPFLYDLEITSSVNGGAVETVKSYFGMRKISLGRDGSGRLRMLLNNQVVFQRGVLDQGYWPDGIYTAPTDEALKYDLEVIRKLGFNMSRKHAKVEPDRWYFWADRLGVLVWQDMPQMFGKDNKLTDEAKEQFAREWREEISQLYNHPSIVVWTTFNEGWGQHATPQVVKLTRRLDPTRLVNNASGWTDEKVGDIHDTHAYPVPACEMPTDTRASVCGEFGGLGMRVDGHMWSKGAWGYQGVYARAYPLTRKYQQLLQTAWKLAEEKGMSAFVYTQITDVEEESNGLMTYDRAIIKPDLEITSAANRGKFAPLPPDPNPPILSISTDEPMIWSYTMDQPADDWFKPEFDASAWKKGPGVFGHNVGSIGTPWESPDIYLRREFTLPDKVPSKLLLRVLHDEDAEIYLNGVLAGKVEKFVDHHVDVPISPEALAVLKPGVNSIAVHCHQTIGGQSIDVGIEAVP